MVHVAVVEAVARVVVVTVVVGRKRGGWHGMGKKGEQKDDDKKEGFVGLDDMKNVTNKLQNYLGFSITDLDRFMKTSGEKNTIASTKDL